jgi:hypothetical protein
MTTSGSNAERYLSIDALRRAHEHLLESLPKSERKATAAEREKSAKRIDEFISRAIATGAILDTLSDRREAQGLIDYWVASAYTRPRSRALTLESAISPIETVEPPREGRADNQLERFDPTVIDTAAEQGDAFINGLSDEDRDLARRIVFRLVHFPDAGDEFDLASARCSELHKFGDPEIVDRLLAGLQAAGILDSKLGEGGADESDTLALRYQALTRRWSWLNGEIKKRMNFRELALSWVGSGRSSGALLDWSLTRRFRRYSNLNDWENEFINTSSRYATRRLVGVATAMVLLALTGLASTRFAYQSLYAPGRVDAVTREIKEQGTSLPQKLNDIRWLANYRQRIEIPGVDLGDREPKDLKEISASGAIMRNSKLTAVRFDEAQLAGASFDRAVIKRTSFQQAYLYRANFESAELCEGVDFTGADVLYASFKRARFFDESVPNFNKVAWWQTYGWGFDEIALLDRHNNKAAIKDSEKFKEELARANNRIEQEKDTYARATALNEKAWMLAIYGVVDGDAESTARQALQLIKELEERKTESQQKNNERQGDNKSPEYNTEKSGFGDTLAYILMQKPENDPANPTKNKDEALALLAYAASARGQGEVLFRYAVALHASNRDAEARENLRRAVLDQQYDPSHELYLLNRYFSGDFRQWVMEMTGRGSRIYPARCDEAGG